MTTRLTAEAQAQRAAPPARGRPETREALLDAVDALMAERGWVACTVQAVARRAGLTTGAIYSTFGSRGELLMAAVNRRSGADTRLPAAGSLADAVAAYARSYFRALDSAATRQLVYAQLDLIRMGATEPSVAEAIRATHVRLVAAIAHDLASRADGPPDAAAAARRLVAVLQGLTLQQVPFAAELDEDDFVGAALAAVGCPG